MCIDITQYRFASTSELGCWQDRLFGVPMKMVSFKRRAHTCAEGSMRVTLSGFENCVYPPWSCRADFTSPEASRTGLGNRAMSSALCISRQMTASVSHFTACSGVDRFQTISLSVTLTAVYSSVQVICRGNADVRTLTSRLRKTSGKVLRNEAKGTYLFEVPRDL
jgi:hypothetical protein